MPRDMTDTARRDWLGLMARAPHETLLDLARPFDREAEMLRAPEIGTVMVRGRTGGTGAPFNLGEMTVTRCALRLDGGAVGHGTVQGRSHGAARAAALIDALMQGTEADAPRRDVLDPLAEAEAARRDARARKAAATKVEFFTLVRGESE